MLCKRVRSTPLANWSTLKLLVSQPPRASGAAAGLGWPGRRAPRGLSSSRRRMRVQGVGGARRKPGGRHLVQLSRALWPCLLGPLLIVDWLAGGDLVPCCVAEQRDGCVRLHGRRSRPRSVGGVRGVRRRQGPPEPRCALREGVHAQA